MNISTWLAGGMACLCFGCGTTRNLIDPAAKTVAPCCLPDFEICLFPEPPVPGCGIITILESNGVVTVDTGELRRPVSSMNDYRTLKRTILNSSLWKENVQADHVSMTFFGPPRDILIIKLEHAGLQLQGSSVPGYWKQRILDLAR